MKGHTTDRACAAALECTFRVASGQKNSTLFAMSGEPLEMSLCDTTTSPQLDFSLELVGFVALDERASPRQAQRALHLLLVAA